MNRQSRTVRLQSRAILAALTVLMTAWAPASAQAPNLRAESQKVMGSPDVSLTQGFEVAASSQVLDKMFNEPLLLANLWNAYQFAPPYQVSMNGKAVHVVDPTGIVGDLYLVDKSYNRRVYYGTGKLNHKLVPKFGGRIALVLTTEAKGKGTSGKADVYVRADNRIMGMLSSAAFPLVKTHAQKRVISNTNDLSVIFKDIEEKPQDVAKRLKAKGDLEKFASLFPASSGPPVATKSVATKSAAGKPSTAKR